MNTVLESQDLRERLRSLWRRRRTMMLAAGGCFLVTLLLAFLLPPLYRSTATILIEQQEIPQDLVRSTITSFADQRIQVISQRVMTTQNLLGIINRYDLYPDIRRSKPREVLLEKMRDDIAMKMISADVIDPRSGRPTQATIAFSIAYENRSPDLALKVANELTSLYLNENLTSRTQLAEQTSVFLRAEATSQAQRITELEGKLASFKEKHSDRLPELAQLNLQVMDRTELELRDMENRIAAIDQQRVLIDAQLAQLSPTSEVFTDTGQRVFSAADRLKALRSQLASLKARYAPGHPDIISTEREIAGLEQQVDADDASGDLARQLTDAKSQLAAARQRYTPAHPDVIRLESLVAGIEAVLAEQPRNPVARHMRATPDNPVYIQVRGQVDALLVEREATVKKRDELRAKLEQYERRMAGAPEVEKEYLGLTRDYENAQRKYQELSAKQSEAQVAQNLETERKGERFTLIEPPLPPEKPVSPNRPLLLGIGLLLSLLAGFGGAALHEALDGSVRGVADIRKLLEVPPLASIPIIETRAERTRQARVLRYSWQGALLALVGSAVTVHFLIRPLDVLWVVLLRRFGV